MDPLVIVISLNDNLYTRADVSFPLVDMYIASDVTGFI